MGTDPAFDYETIGAGLTDPADVDCFVAMIAGLIDAQASNDPGGTRWIRHLDLYALARQRGHVAGVQACQPVHMRARQNDHAA